MTVAAAKSSFGGRVVAAAPGVAASPATTATSIAPIPVKRDHRSTACRIVPPSYAYRLPTNESETADRRRRLRLLRQRHAVHLEALAGGRVGGVDLDRDRAAGRRRRHRGGGELLPRPGGGCAGE